MQFSRQKFKDAKYCPFCGVPSLDRDPFAQTLKRPRYKNEFVCRACGWGLAINPSLRHQLAASMSRSERQLRAPTPKPPADDELSRLAGYLRKLKIPVTVRRSKNHPRLFVFETATRRIGKSTDYKGAMAMLIGIHTALRNGWNHRVYE